MKQTFVDFFAVCKKQLSTRTFKQGLFSLALISLVLAVIVTANVLLSVLPTIYTSFDLTTRKQNENLSAVTKDYVSALERDIYVYLLWADGMGDARIERILERYAALSDRLHIEHINPELHPDFARANGVEQELSEGSFLVKSDLRVTAVDYTEYYLDPSNISFASGLLTFEPTTYLDSYEELANALLSQGYTESQVLQLMSEMTYSEYKQMMDSEIPDTILDLENKLTTSIDFVNREHMSVVYQLTGHGETSLNQTLATNIAGENVLLRDLDLLTAGGVPDDCGSLIISAPTSQFSDADLTVLKSYLADGGHLLLLGGDYSLSPALYDLLETEYGVGMKNGTVFDPTRQNGNAAHVVPIRGEHAGVHAGVNANTNVVLFRARPLTVTERVGITATPLLTTSSDAWLRPADSTASGLSMQTDKGDVAGTYHLAVAVEAPRANGATTQIVWYGTSSIANIFQTNYQNDLNTITSGGNYTYLLSTLLWNVDHSGALALGSATMTFSPLLLITTANATVWLIVLAVLLPLSILVFGLVLLAKRRAR